MGKLKLNFTTIYRYAKQKALSVRLSESGRLVVFFGLALALTLTISDHDAVAEVLFQSPASPPAPAQQPQIQPQAIEQQPPVQQQPPAPAQPPPAPIQPQQEAAPQQANPIEQAQPLPEQEIDPVTGQPIEPADQAAEPVAPAVPESPDGSGQQPEGEAAPLEPPPFPEPALRSERIDRFEETAEDEGSSNFVLDMVELIDTLVVSVAWVWLCCGAGMFLLIPIVFLFLQIRGRTKILHEENL